MPVETKDVSDKDLAIQAIQHMAKESSLQNISDELAILAAIRRGEAAADAGHVISHQEMKQRSKEWTTK